MKPVYILAIVLLSIITYKRLKEINVSIKTKNMAKLKGDIFLLILSFAIIFSALYFGETL